MVASLGAQGGRSRLFAKLPNRLGVVPWARSLLGAAEGGAAAGLVVGLFWPGLGLASATGAALLLLGAVLAHLSPGIAGRDLLPPVVLLGVPSPQPPASPAGPEPSSETSASMRKGTSMSYTVLTNPVTKERGIVRRRPDEQHPRLLADLYAAPGAAVAAEHVHPRSSECFTVVRGELRVRVDGTERGVGAGTRVVIPPGTPHDWWNDGTETAHVIVEVDPGRRFEAMIRNVFGLAADGKTDAKGRPHLLQAALLAREFDDVIRFTSPPRVVQRPLFAALAVLARMRGLQGSYPRYLDGPDETVAELEPLPAEIAALVPGL